MEGMKGWREKLVYQDGQWTLSPLRGTETLKRKGLRSETLSSPPSRSCNDSFAAETHV